MAKKKEWSACLAKSGGMPGKCEALEKDLRAMSKASNVDVCINETLSLMRCTSSSSKRDGCGCEFMAMRECNRIGGKQFVPENGAYTVAPGKSNLFEPSAAGLAASVVPVRTLQAMQEFGQEYAKSLGIQPGELRI
eukprot:CAMPEP_0180497008 /NCGR_PEP_ID=MMETSP1036_2-20121128/42574_1 /TAXON_ID=632150 /ORGANISM="Azadinium spinosum, Strain 3D9" /LENGTH=135 /DNA_ID=CAMNT_0022505549 /DNA_START=102 /DNA_END=509 /DNA_ORIENTATION=+